MRPADREPSTHPVVLWPVCRLYHVTTTLYGASCSPQTHVLIDLWLFQASIQKQGDHCPEASEHWRTDGTWFSMWWLALGLSFNRMFVKTGNILCLEAKLELLHEAVTLLLQYVKCSYDAFYKRNSYTHRQSEKTLKKGQKALITVISETLQWAQMSTDCRSSDCTDRLSPAGGS